MSVCLTVFHRFLNLTISLFRHNDKEAAPGLGAVPQNGDVGRVVQSAPAHCQRVLPGKCFGFAFFCVCVCVCECVCSDVPHDSKILRSLQMGQFYYAAKGFDVLERLDPNPSFFDVRNCVCGMLAPWRVIVSLRLRSTRCSRC